MAGFHVMADARGMHVQPTVRRITTSDLWDALRLGFEDFWAKPSHYVFLCLIYPIVGLILTQWTSGANATQLIYPLMSGFALLWAICGPRPLRDQPPARARHEHLLAARV